MTFFQRQFFHVFFRIFLKFFFISKKFIENFKMTFFQRQFFHLIFPQIVLNLLKISTKKFFFIRNFEFFFEFDVFSKKMELKENAKKEIFKQEIIHKRIKERTWDTMDSQLKAINGLRENYLIYNYNIRKRPAEELRRLIKTSIKPLNIFL